jgi:molybdopterin molybdotransferase
MALLSVDQARERILSQLQPVTTEIRKLTDCANRVLAENIVASTDLPPFDNSSMDGFAVRAADVANATDASPLRLNVVADIPAGSAPTVSLTPGQAARIMTGAQMPAGANAVVPVEETDFTTRNAGSVAPKGVQIFKAAKPGANIRTRGMDMKAGEIVLEKGRRLQPQDLGLLAMLGVAETLVHRKPRIALLSSGDELVSVELPLEPGKIRDSNSHVLAALIESAHAEVLRLGVAQDNRPSVEGLFEQALEQSADMIVSSAGVSVGAFDYIKEVVDARGRMDFWRVNMRPGKPLAFGDYRSRPFIGLPGNPVSAFVGFEVFVRAALGRLGGELNGDRRAVRVRSEEEIDSDGRESYLRAVVEEKNGVLVAHLTGHQGSGNLRSLVQANALLIIPAGVKCVPAGQEVNAWLL